MNTKKYLFLFIMPVLFISLAFSQYDTIRNGAYLNGIEFNRNNPLYSSDFKFIKKTGPYAYSEEIRMINLYDIESRNPKIKRNTIKKMLWGIYDDHSFYLNARKIGMANGYIKIDSLKLYSYFRGKPILTPYQGYRLDKAGFEYGLIGTAVTAEKISYENRENVHYILNAKNGLIHLLNKDYLLRILQPHGDLLLLYNLEEDKDSIFVMFKYVDLINERQ